MALNVSLLLDGQLGAEETAAALTTIAGDAALRDRYTIYGLAGDALRGISVPDDGFSKRIFERIRREGAQMSAGYDPLTDRD